MDLGETYTPPKASQLIHGKYHSTWIMSWYVISQWCTFCRCGHVRWFPGEGRRRDIRSLAELGSNIIQAGGLRVKKWTRQLVIFLNLYLFFGHCDWWHGECLLGALRNSYSLACQQLALRFSLPRCQTKLDRRPQGSRFSFIDSFSRAVPKKVACQVCPVASDVSDQGVNVDLNLCFLEFSFGLSQRHPWLTFLRMNWWTRRNFPTPCWVSCVAEDKFKCWCHENTVAKEKAVQAWMAHWSDMIRSWLPPLASEQPMGNWAYSYERQQINW